MVNLSFAFQYSASSSGMSCFFGQPGYKTLAPENKPDPAPGTESKFPIASLLQGGTSSLQSSQMPLALPVESQDLGVEQGPWRECLLRIAVSPARVRCCSRT